MFRKEALLEEPAPRFYAKKVRHLKRSQSRDPWHHLRSVLANLTRHRFLETRCVYISENFEKILNYFQKMGKSFIKIIKNCRFPLIFDKFCKNSQLRGSPPSNPYKYIFLNFCPNFREKFDKILKNHCKNGKIIIKIIKN